MNFGRVRQISESHCGVAALEILMRLNGVVVDQRQLTKLAGVEKEIYKRGVRVDELEEAVAKIESNLKLSWKENASLKEIEVAVKSGFWVGVEWQGLFGNKDDSEARREARLGYCGHYAVISDINLERDVLVMTDPYKTFYKKDRIFSAKWFEKRWWDWNLLERNGRLHWVKQRKVMFIVAQAR